jgi:hypothetical protein
MKIPKYNIGDIVGTKICSDKYYNEWYSDPSKIIKIEYMFLPYKSSMSYCPHRQFVYTLEDKRSVAERDIIKLNLGFW